MHLQPAQAAAQRAAATHQQRPIQAAATAQRVAAPRRLSAPSSPPADHTASSRSSSQPGRPGPSTPRPAGFDIVLSSGFLAFAQHAGFLAAVEDAGLPVNAVMGTSAGALSGSLWAAGFSAREVAEILGATAPIARLRPCCPPWAGPGLLRMDAVVEELRGLLPPRFEDLQRPLGVGLASVSGGHLLVDSGSLPEPVAASAAIPVVFAPVPVPGVSGGPFMDGGIHCRIGLGLWREQKYGASPGAAPPAVVHLIGRSSPFSGNDDTRGLGSQNAVVLKTPKSGRSFWDLGDFEADFENSRRRALPLLRELVEAQQAGDEDEQPWQQQRRPDTVV